MFVLGLIIGSISTVLILYLICSLMIDTKDNTEKTFKRIMKMKKQLQKYGMLPINKKWKGL